MQPARNIAILLQSIMLLVLACNGVGCATASIAAVGTVAGFASDAITTGSSVYRLGKLDSVDLATIDQMETAVRAMAKELKLSIIEEEKSEDGEWYFKLKDDEDATIEITLHSRTEIMCKSRVNVGWFGSEPTARLILQRVRDRLPLPPEVRPPATSRPAWPEDPRGPLNDEHRDIGRAKP
jgi:hypothetical protein